MQCDRSSKPMFFASFARTKLKKSYCLPQTHDGKRFADRTIRCNPSDLFGNIRTIVSIMRNHGRCTALLSNLLVLLGTLLAAATGNAQCKNETISECSSATSLQRQIPCDRSQDEIWLVSSRNLSPKRVMECDCGELDVFKLNDNKWNKSSYSEFMQKGEEDASLPTVVFIHGNRTDLQYAKIRGLQTYRAVVQDCKLKTPVIFVIWTWPADKVCGIVQDLNTKAKIADNHSYLMARFISRLDHKPKVRIIGYSYGGRMVVNALHLLQG